MKKKLLKSLFLGSLAVILAACSWDSLDEPTNVETPTTETVDTNDERYQIYLLASNAGYTGTYQEWLESIRGASIALQVSDGYIQMKYSDQTNWTNLISIDELKGETGINGKSTELKVNDGFIQWKYTDEDGWKNLISLSALTGEAGKEIELSANEEYIVWKYKDAEVWNNLVSLASLKGDTGVSIKNVEISNDGDLILSYSDGNIVNAGKVKENTEFNHTYTVTFDPDNGKEPFTQVIPWGGGPKIPDDPAEAGYELEGWYLGNKKWDFYTNYYPYDMTLTAKYKLKDLKVHYYGLDGKLDNWITAHYGEYVSIITLESGKPGYHFTGWVDENGNKVDSGIWNYKTDIYLYDTWEENDKVTVTFDTNGGSLDISSENVTIGSYYEAPKPTKEGVIFDGWYDEDGKQYKDGYFEYKSNVKFKAKWRHDYESIQDKNITIWVTEQVGLTDQVKNQILSYLESKSLSGFNVEVLPNSGGGSALIELNNSQGKLPDMYMVFSDQLQTCVKKGYASKIPTEYAKSIAADNTAAATYTVTVGENLYGYPMTIDNGYFMYYDKSVFAGVNMNSLEDIIKRCIDTNTNLCFEYRNGWYVSSMFFATGCRSDWSVDETSQFVSVNDTFNSEAGYVALRKIYDLVKSKCVKDSSSTNDFGTSNRSSAVISGTWGKYDAENILGDNYGVCKLPSFTGCDNKTYQMGCFAGGKILSISPQQEALKEELLNDIALYLTNEENEIDRYREFGWAPSNTSAIKLDIYENNLAVTALLDELQYGVPQGPIYGDWWNIISDTIDSAVRSDGLEATLKQILADYEESVNKCLALEGNLLVASWQGWNNKDLSARMKQNGNDWVMEFYIEDDSKENGCRIVEAGTWNGVAGYSNVDSSSKEYLDITACEDSNNVDGIIYFASTGYYKLTYNDETKVITITKEF